MRKSIKCPKCGYDMPDEVCPICKELLENKEFLSNVLTSNILSNEAKKELQKIKSLIDRINKLYQ